MSWSCEVLERDKTCLCGKPAEEAHHIYPKAAWPELRLDRNNGIGLCKACHYAIYGEEEAHIERFLRLRPAQARAIGRILPFIVKARGVELGVTTR